MGTSWTRSMLRSRQKMLHRSDHPWDEEPFIDYGWMRVGPLMYAWTHHVFNTETVVYSTVVLPRR